MFDCAYFYAVLYQYSAAGGITYIFCHCINYWLSFKVNTLDFIPVVVRCRIKCHRQVYSGMQAFSV